MTVSLRGNKTARPHFPGAGLFRVRSYAVGGSGEVSVSTAACNFANF